MRGRGKQQRWEALGQKNPKDKEKITGEIFFTFECNSV